jgi:hypothetical protein
VGKDWAVLEGLGRRRVIVDNLVRQRPVAAKKAKGTCQFSSTGRCSPA